MGRRGPFRLAQARGQLVVDGTRACRALGEQGAAALRQPEPVPPPVVGNAYALDGGHAFEPAGERHHAARHDPHRPCDLLL
nr:hypothetical protein [Streptomyces sp. 142MFCol3.1]